MIVSKHVEISKNLSADIIFGEDGIFRCHWAPTVPQVLKKAEVENYLAGWNQLLAEALGLRADLALSAYVKASWLWQK
jgi:hypothetical protein